jgi:membrane fusion protein (multidrug efflux system)
MSRKQILFAAAALLAVACSKPAPPEKAGAAQPATSDLPADVAGLAPDAPPATVAAPGAPGATDPGAAAQPAETGSDPSVLATTGEFVSSTRTELAPKNSGRVAAVYVDEGDRVTRGQVLLRQETDYARLELARAQADLDRLKAAEADTRRDLERKRELLAKESTPRATFDRAQGAAEQAQAAVAAAASAVQLAQRRIDDAALRSPVTGVVTERRSTAGEHLGNDGVAFVLQQTAPLKLRFSVPERYLGSIRQGQSVAAEADPYPGETFGGSIQTVGGTIDPQTRTFFAEATFANADGRLRPGLFARVKVPLSAGKGR